MQLDTGVYTLDLKVMKFDLPRAISIALFPDLFGSPKNELSLSLIDANVRV